MDSSKTTLGFFKNLILSNGLERLKVNFHQLSNSNLRDSRKEYDDENEAYYLFRESPETNEVSNESYPIKFEDQLENRIKKEIKYTLNKIDQQLEERQDVESVNKYLQFIKNDVNNLISYTQKADTFSEYDIISRSLKSLKSRIEEISESYTLSESTDLISEFALEFTNSPRAKYPARTVETYIRYYEKLKTLKDFRSKIKSKLDDLNIEYPADQGLTNWEDNWEVFQDSRTEN